MGRGRRSGGGGYVCKMMGKLFMNIWLKASRCTSAAIMVGFVMPQKQDEARGEEGGEEGGEKYGCRESGHSVPTYNWQIPRKLVLNFIQELVSLLVLTECRMHLPQICCSCSCRQTKQKRSPSEHNSPGPLYSLSAVAYSGYLDYCSN